LLFGPVLVTSAEGMVTRTIEVGEADAGDVTLVVRQADERRGTAEIALDGQPVVHASDLGQHEHEVSRSVSLSQASSLTVRAPGAPVLVSLVGRAYPIRDVSATVLDPQHGNVLVRAALKLRNPFTVPTVTLERVEADGRRLGVCGTLADDGDEQHGDDVASDGTFSLIEPAPADAAPVYFRIRIERDGVAEYSRVFTPKP
jgi:hypothetical protein